MFATRLLAVALLRSARPTFQHTYHNHFTPYKRSFSVSLITRAGPAPEIPREFTAELQKTIIWKKLANDPEAIAAIQDFGRLLQKAGESTPSHHFVARLTYLRIQASIRQRANPQPSK